MTPDDKPRSREALAEDVAARMRAAGLDAASDGENVTVREPQRAVGEEGASTGRNILTVLGVTLGGFVIALVASLIWFGLVFTVLGGGASAATDAGQRAGAVGFTVATLIAGAGALMTGWDRRTLAGKADGAARVLGLVLGLPLLAITLRTGGAALDAVAKGHGKLGIVAALLFFGLFGYVGDRVLKKR